MAKEKIEVKHTEVILVLTLLSVGIDALQALHQKLYFAVLFRNFKTSKLVKSLYLSVESAHPRIRNTLIIKEIFLLSMARKGMNREKNREKTKRHIKSPVIQGLFYILLEQIKGVEPSPQPWEG